MGPATCGLVMLGRAVGRRAGRRLAGRIPHRTYSYIRVKTNCSPAEETHSMHMLTSFSHRHTWTAKGPRTHWKPEPAMYPRKSAARTTKLREVMFYWAS